MNDKMIDIVFPKDNAKEFIMIAEKLGHNGLVLVYDKHKDVSGLQKETGLKLYLTTAKKIIKNKGDARQLFEKSKNAIIFDLENQEKDFTKLRNSGLNEVICEIAKKNNIIIGLSFSSILDSRKKSIIIGRMMQNAMLCKKKRVQIILASFADNPWQMRSRTELTALAKEVGLQGKTSFLNDLKADSFLNKNQ